MKHLKYIIPSIITLGALTIFIIYPFHFASANPDYICVKAVSRACEIDTSLCSQWSNGLRTCPGKRTTQVSYFLTRTTCEAWYLQIRWGSNDWASGRSSSDIPYASENCSITQTDKTPPIWDSSVLTK